MEQVKTTREQFVENAKIGDIVAFRMSFANRAMKMLSGKIIDKMEGGYVIQTSKGSVYNVVYADIQWVQIPGRGWPSGIFNALKQS